MDEYTRRELAEAIRYATLAPSTHNSQPWKFDIVEGAVRLYPDYDRRLPVVDPRNRELFISLGCALENLVVALAYHGYGPVVSLFPADEPSECLRVTFRGGPKRTNAELFEAVTKRQTNRSEYEPRRLDDAMLAKLRAVPMEPGVSLFLSDAEKVKSAMLRLVMDADEAEMMGEHFREELGRWLRFNRREARTRRDGLSFESIGFPEGPRWLGSFFLRHRDAAATRADRDLRLLETSAAIALISTTEDTKKAWVDAGRSFERFALTATALGVQHAHMNQPIEIPDGRPNLGKILETPAGYPQLLLRLGYAQPLPYSLRRPVEDVLIETIDTLLPDRTPG